MSRFLTVVVGIVNALLILATLASAMLYSETKEQAYFWNLFIFPAIMTVMTIAHGIHEDNRNAARREAMRRHPSARGRSLFNQDGTKL